MKDIYIHVGMAKALSTSLRNSFFPKVDNSFLVYGEHNIQNPIHKLIKFLSIMQEKYKSLIKDIQQLEKDLYIGDGKKKHKLSEGKEKAIKIREKRLEADKKKLQQKLKNQYLS